MDLTSFYWCNDHWHNHWHNHYIMNIDVISLMTFLWYEESSHISL